MTPATGAGVRVGARGGLRALYRMLDEFGDNPLKAAHAALDADVLRAYGFTAGRDVLEELLALNHRVSAAADATGPGIPPEYPRPATLVSDDRVEPRE